MKNEDLVLENDRLLARIREMQAENSRLIEQVLDLQDEAEAKEKEQKWMLLLANVVLFVLALLTLPAAFWVAEQLSYYLVSSRDLIQILFFAQIIPLWFWLITRSEKRRRN